MTAKLQSQLLENFPLTSSKTSTTVNKHLVLTGHTSTQLNNSSVLLKGLGKSSSNFSPSSTTSGAAKRRRLDSKHEVPSAQVFSGRIFVTEFSSTASFSEKSRIRAEIKDAGGVISHMLTKKVSAVIAMDNKCLESFKCRNAVTLSIPVVSYQFIVDSIDRGVCEDVDGYRLLGLTRTDQLQTGKILDTRQGKIKRIIPPSSVDWKSFPPHTDDSDIEYMDQPDGYSVPKWAFLSTKAQGLCVVEIHVIELKDVKQFKVATLHYSSHHALASASLMEVRNVDGPLQAELLFASLHSYYELTLGCKRLDKVPFGKGSLRLRQNLFSWTISSGEVGASVRQLVDMIWNEAVGEVEKNMSVNISSLSRAVVEQAEGILVEMKDNLKAGKDNSQLSKEFYNTLPFKPGCRSDLSSLKAISAQFNMIQLLYDLLSVGEATDWNLKATTQTKLKSLNCHLAEEEMNGQLPDLLFDVYSSDEDVRIDHVYAVTRPTEHLVQDGKERRLLFHASNPENYLGILSRGLLMPKHVVDDFGGKRTDAGNLGSGIYFADEFRTSNGYTRSFTGNGRLMLVCEVVTGKLYSTTNKMADLLEPPSGYDSVKAEKATEIVNSEFKSNEYCVYNTKQQVLKYIIQYTTSEDRQVLPLPQLYAPGPTAMDDVQEQGEATTSPVEDDISGIKLEQVLPGLQVEGDSKEPIPLRRISVVGKIADLTAEVTVFQEYQNMSSNLVETKFVFPLNEMAAVCGFEAYINGKHIVGEVKEKETAQREYRQAVDEGHGAYLMVQDKERPDVFTVSVGNLPPHCIALIKITYICELTVKEEKLVFELPNSLAPWNVDQALAEKTQSKTESVGLDPDWLKRIECDVQLSLQMPFEIRQIDCPSHDVKIKKTDLMAMIEMKEGQSLADGFTLNVSLAEIHVPRMIIENHPDNPEDKQACMLTFYPEFECEAQESFELIIMLDMSNSMSADDITSSKKIALILLNSLNKHVFFNIVVFGSTYSELFLKSVPANKVNIKQAVSYIQACASRHGNTDLLTPLTNLSMLTDTCRHRNVVVISDGHMTHGKVTLQAVTGMYGTVRLFTLAVSKEANKFMMRELARLGSGAMEYMNPSAKSKWLSQIRGVVEKAAQPLLSQVKVVWQEQNVDLETPLQAPACIPSIFNGSRVVVYGFASNCYMATLKAVINGREVSTVVSASPLSCQTGLTVHRLAARAVIQDWEHGCLSDDSVEHLALKKKQKASIIKMSMEFSIITQFTSFVAIEKREKNETFTGNDPDMDELVNGIVHDLLPYMNYESSTYSSQSSDESSFDDSDSQSEDNELYEDDYCGMEIDSIVANEVGRVKDNVLMAKAMCLSMDSEEDWEDFSSPSYSPTSPGMTTASQDSSKNRLSHDGLMPEVTTMSIPKPAMPIAMKACRSAAPVSHSATPASLYQSDSGPQMDEYEACYYPSRPSFDASPPRRSRSRELLEPLSATTSVSVPVGNSLFSKIANKSDVEAMNPLRGSNYDAVPPPPPIYLPFSASDQALNMMGPQSSDEPSSQFMFGSSPQPMPRGGTASFLKGSAAKPAALPAAAPATFGAAVPATFGAAVPATFSAAAPATFGAAKPAAFGAAQPALAAMPAVSAANQMTSAPESFASHAQARAVPPPSIAERIALLSCAHHVGYAEPKPLQQQSSGYTMIGGGLPKRGDVKATDELTPGQSSLPPVAPRMARKSKTMMMSDSEHMAKKMTEDLMQSRGEKLEELVQKSSELSKRSSSFKIKASVDSRQRSFGSDRAAASSSTVEVKQMAEEMYDCAEISADEMALVSSRRRHAECRKRRIPVMYGNVIPPMDDDYTGWKERRMEKNYMSRSMMRGGMQFQQSRSAVQVKIKASQPGIYIHLPGKGRTLLVDYETLKDFPWKESLHVINFDPQPADYVCRLFDETADDLQELKSHILSVPKFVKGFSYSAFETVLINAGLMSLGKTAAREVVMLFFAKLSLVAVFLEQLSKRYVGEAFDTKLLERLLDSSDEQEARKVLDDLDGAGDIGDELPGLWKKYRDVMSQLELGRRWSTVIINMVCSADNHQVDFIDE